MAASSWKLTKQILALQGRQGGHRPHPHPRRQRREQPFDNPRSQFQRTLARAVRSDRAIAMPHYLHGPHCRHVLPNGSHPRPMDDSVNDHLGQRDVQPRQLLAKKLSLRFVEPPADLSFKRFEPALILPTTVPPFFNELQQPLQRLPANNPTTLPVPSSLNFATLSMGRSPRVIPQRSHRFSIEVGQGRLNSTPPSLSKLTLSDQIGRITSI